ncbi:hypothetical protein EVAR_75643_1 [Eumeta japonica]|uniref:Uncharacterized protein n=1 Tax=Eumeta variegata TaxID=151549 RepID=A0A4C1U003_EUMVA|nr:hypothetical protein EVAR_75643_1 [Eumeta japonica]
MLVLKTLEKVRPKVHSAVKASSLTTQRSADFCGMYVYIRMLGLSGGRNQEEWATLAQNKSEMKKAADELYQLPETDTESSAPSEENDE